LECGCEGVTFEVEGGFEEASYAYGAQAECFDDGGDDAESEFEEG